MTRIVSFNGETTGAYISVDPVDVDTEFQLTLKMKTAQADGLVYYVTDDRRVSSLSDGKINVTTD